MSEEEIRSDLAYFFLQFVAISNYWNQPVYLGGEKADGTTEINELSYLFLDVYDQMSIYTPKIQLKLSDSTPKNIVYKMLDMIRRGNNSLVFVCEKTIREALVRNGATEEEARTCVIKGCYEYGTIGSYGAGMNYLNLLKPLEYTLHEGRDAVTGEAAGLPCPPPSAFDTFDKFLAEYERQLKNVIDLTVEVVNGFEGYLAEMNPLSMLSATFPTCLAQGKDAIAGGSLHNGSELMFGGLADVADSFTMIQKHVYEQKTLTLSELVAMLDRNFEGEGDEIFRQALLRDREKYGNNQARPNEFAKYLISIFQKNLCGRPNNEKRGGTWSFGTHVARQSYVWGDKSLASPNGRKRGDEVSKNASPTLGQAKSGATAAILSVTELDASVLPADFALDLGLLPSAVRGDEGLDAMYGLVKTFQKRGGHAIQINVFDADTLRDAQKNPEKYADLQIRVSGWNVLWNNISKEEQDGFIRQAEALQ